MGVRDGCFCAHVLVKRLLGIPPVREVLADAGLRLAPRLTKSMLPGLVRVSFGIENDERDIDRLVHSLMKIAAEPVCLMNRALARTHNATPVVPDTDVWRRIRAAVERQAGNVFGTARRNDPGVPESAPGMSGQAPSPGPKPPRPAAEGFISSKVWGAGPVRGISRTGRTLLGLPCCRKH